MSSASPMANLSASFRRGAVSRTTLIFGGTLLALSAGMWMIFHDQFSLLGAGVFLAVLLLISLRNKALAIHLAIVYLFLLGDIRRIFDMTGEMPKFDPLLLVGPIFSIILALPILMTLRLTDPMSKAVTALMAIMTLEIFNPKQGPIVVGVAGAMFYLIPMFWFWIGRQYGTIPVVYRIMQLGLIPLGVLAAVLGMIQTYIGFLPWERAWIDNVASHFTALNLGGGFIRAFGYSVNGVEFVAIMLTGCTAAMAMFFAGRRAYMFLVPIIVWGIFLSSSRGAILRCLFAICASWALSSKGGRGWALRLVLALGLGVLALGFSVTRATQAAGDHSGGFTSAADASTQHQLQGLSDPLNAKHSTAGVHSQMFLAGLMKGITYPIGYGLGATTLGSSRLGGDSSAAGSSEVDLSDVFTNTGLIGGAVYLWMFFLILKRAIRFGRTAPRVVGLSVLGVIFALLGQWLALGSYAMTPLTWFFIGAISRSMADPLAERNPQQVAFSPHLART
ncbi:hypothetical protein [Silvibacterium dinghuense]|uniref:Uncharacterized protein n=1 Tax=Silvibacterium dinghuense TaxID=1560006 RepID=A0A4V1NV91_9BACT|nr:hypothetical protein [Silvibacterium dinghuense]RXS94950.1 hypothetical protein ESZ00_09945 [Silvibacterium dinghuense]